MKKHKIYLDTSVINFLFADDAPEKKEITIDFFANFIKKSKYETYISPFVIDEIQATKDKKKKDTLLAVLKHYPINVLQPEQVNELDFLAQKYLDEKIIPEKNIIDAYHIAISVISQIDFLVSWNYKHLANINKEQKIRSVNIRYNYLHDLRIITPLELMDYEN